MAAVEVRVVSAERPTAGCDACFRFQEAGGREGGRGRSFEAFPFIQQQLNPLT